ncbi:MAG: CsgG/HfaB family protein, partial [Spirochaetia bacterium]|nr:CsgG/HfaB family protein [Spirochaetia bacterium]
MKSAIDIYIIRIILFLIIFLVVSACKSTLSVKGADGEFTDAGNGSFSFLSSEEKEHKIAVIEFSGEDGSTSYNTAVTDEVIRRVSREKNTKLIERSRLDAVLKEQSLQESGMISPEDSVKIGQVLPVDIIVSGKYKKDKGDLK